MQENEKVDPLQEASIYSSRSPPPAHYADYANLNVEDGRH